MKKWLLRCVLAILCLVFLVPSLQAAPLPEGFVGVPWGSSRARVQQILGERGWVRVNQSSPDQEVYKGSFDGMAAQLHFRLVNNSFVEGYTFALARMLQLQWTQASYNTTVGHLAEKYGPPHRRERGYYQAALGPMTAWEFVDGATQDKYSIQVVLSEDGTWFSDLDSKKYYYYMVVYRADSLSERLKRSAL